MPKSFAITTTATETLRADAQGHAEAGFTVTNTTSRPIRGLAKVRPLGDTKQEWLKLQGEAERDFAAGATQQFTVSFNGPAIEPASATSAGSTAPPTGAPSAPVTRKYPFRLDVESALNPDEDFTEGPTVTVETMTARPIPNGTHFPKWIIFVILGILLLIGIIVLVVVLMSGDKEETGGDGTPKPSSTESVSPPTEQPSPTESAEDQCIKIASQNQNLSPNQAKFLCKGTSNPQEPPKCVERVGPKKAIPIPGQPQLTFQQAVGLCAGTNDTQKTVSCFQARIDKKVTIDQAIIACRPKQ